MARRATGIHMGHGVFVGVEGAEGIRKTIAESWEYEKKHYYQGSKTRHRYDSSPSNSRCAREKWRTKKRNEKKIRKTEEKK